MIVSFCSSQILSGTSGPSAAPQKGKEGADSENLEVRNTKCHWKENSFEKKKTVEMMLILTCHIDKLSIVSLCSRTCAPSSSPVLARTLHLPTICTGEYDSEQLRDWKCLLFFCFCQLNLCVIFLRYVIVECEDQDTQQRDPKTHEMYLNVMRRFSQALLKVRNVALLSRLEDIDGHWPIYLQI